MNKKTGRPKKEIAYKEDLIRKAEGIMEMFKDYTYGINCMLLIYRAKEGAPRANNSHLRKVIVNGNDEFKDKLLFLLKQKEDIDAPLRIYSTVNPRNINKAIRQFKLEQIEADYYGIDDRDAFYVDIHNRFFGALMTPSSRDSTRFLIDVDDEVAHVETLKKLPEIGVGICDIFKTKNGWHIITEPFNPNHFTVANTGIKKDGLLLLDW